ncbi:ABC transporter ATP-binding protein [Salipaludibacillus sp. HK11]|uniref:ABC transporter ATP-binding protein n=1 Tax=Salipaludibacillus sp. HK11 TaxID=3394320 RepID=UPI0039FC0405
MQTILETKGIKKQFGKNKKMTVLNNITLTVKEGEFVSIMGPSGSGKSTLLYTLSGMDQISDGSVVLDGQELATLTEKQLAELRLTKMGFIFQNHHLLKNLTLFDNIILSAYLSKKDSRKKVNRKASELMKKTGISQLKSHDLTQASGGQLQRVAICRSLINEPRILFGDEPTGSLNSQSATDIMSLLKTINESGTTILLVTHDQKVAAKTERVLYMIDGEIVGEKLLQKFDGKSESLQKREESLATWLRKMGF